ncbi:thioredoxin [Clostridia bacterium]|nr:thioredoxin [Clostridia bacterium]
MAVITLTAENFDSEVLQSDKTVLIDFWAPWCTPCRAAAPIVDSISREREDIKVGKVNIDDYPNIAETYDIMSIPTLVVVTDGITVSKTVGVKSKDAILGMLPPSELNNAQ